MSEEIQSILPLTEEAPADVPPKRKRAPAKKAASKKPADATSEGAKVEIEDKPKRRARKTAVEANGTEHAATETQVRDEAPAVVESQIEKPPAKARKTPVRRKKAAEPAESESSAASGGVPAQMETPSAPATVSPPVESPSASAEAAPAAAVATPNAGVAAPPGRPSVEGGEETGGDESNRSRRWKERRNRFKKWKEMRKASRTGQGGEAGADGGENAGAQGGESEPAPALLGPPEPADGILELTPKGYGFLRQKSRSYAQFAQDPFVSPELIRQYGLREGMQVKGKACKAQRGPQVTEISEVNERAPEAMRDLPLFEELKAINPCKRVQLETDKNRLTTRTIDMFTPVGRGQRGLIVAPPRTGKTTLLQHIAEAITANHPGMHLILLLVDERPEEVTEFKRVLPNAEIFASSNDQDIKSHTRIAQFAIERAKRLVECGEHVFILLDSITRLARAFNNAKQGGATMSGGVGVGALEIPRRLFAAARNTREAGSLTILATALIETGSRMDDLIFQEFKGTGNMELVLDRKIAEQFYYPAVNIFKSGTRREELLLQPFQLDKIHMLRRGLAGHKPIEALQRVLSLLERYPGNAQMLVDLPSKS